MRAVWPCIASVAARAASRSSSCRLPARPPLPSCCATCASSWASTFSPCELVGSTPLSRWMWCPRVNACCPAASALPGWSSTSSNRRSYARSMRACTALGSRTGALGSARWASPVSGFCASTERPGDRAASASAASRATDASVAASSSPSACSSARTEDAWRWRSWYALTAASPENHDGIGFLGRRMNELRLTCPGATSGSQRRT